MLTYAQAADDSLPTRRSLLSRLKNWDDHESWKVFFDTYWRLLYSSALRAGLTDAEAQDVVQETVIAVMNKLPEFKYDANGSFKGWLLRQTSWRIGDQFRKRRQDATRRRRDSDTATHTEELERLPDPVSEQIEEAWNAEWRANLLEVAVERVKRKVDPKHFQAFDLCVTQKWAVARVAQTLNLTPARIYLIKHRINRLLKKEIIHLQTKLI